MGVKVCKNKKNYLNQLTHLFKKYDDLILEEYIGGQEIQVAVINGKSSWSYRTSCQKRFFMITKQNIQKKQKQNT